MGTSILPPVRAYRNVFTIIQLAYYSSHIHRQLTLSYRRNTRRTTCIDTVIIELVDSVSRDGPDTPICDRIWENPAYCENAQVAQCTFLVSQVKNCQSPIFILFMSKNLSTNLPSPTDDKRKLPKPNKIRPLDLPRLCSCRVRSLFPRALIGISVCGLS